MGLVKRGTQFTGAGGPLLSGCDDTVEAGEQVLGVRPVREDDVRRALAPRLELPPQHVPVATALEKRRRFVARYFPSDPDNPTGRRESQHDAALGRLGVFYERPPQLLGRAGNQAFDPHDVLPHFSLSGISRPSARKPDPPSARIMSAPCKPYVSGRQSYVMLERLSISELGARPANDASACRDSQTRNRQGMHAWGKCVAGSQRRKGERASAPNPRRRGEQLRFTAAE